MELVFKISWASAAVAAAAVQEAAARAAAAAAAHRAGVLATPLWQHSLQCAATIGAGLVATVLISRTLHREADRVQAGEVQHSQCPHPADLHSCRLDTE